MILDESYLEHFGVKGMRWGQRRTARQQNRALNKASRAKDIASRDSSIDASRQYVKSKQAKADFKIAKQNFKSNKEQLGSREAKKILAIQREFKYSQIQNSRQAKHGSETVKSILLGAGFLGVSLFFREAARRM